MHRLSPSQQNPSNESNESSSLSLSQSNLSACGPSTKQESPKNKWLCPTCTYINHMRTQRCNQCCAKRETANTLTTTTGTTTMATMATTIAEATGNLPEQIKALSIRGSDPELNSTLNRTSPMGSANSLYGSRTNLGAAGARNSPVEQNKVYCGGKWICTVCVYITKEINIFFLQPCSSNLIF